MKSDLNFLLSTAGFVLAIFTCSFFKLGFSFFIFLLLLSAVILIFQKFFVIEEGERKRIFFLFLFILFFALGILRYEIKDLVSLDINLENNVGTKVIVEGIVFDEPIMKESRAILVVDFKKINISSSSVSVYGRGIISTDLYPEFKYGDLVRISGKLEKPENFVLSSSSNFDYISYLGKDDIFYKIDFAKTEFISSGHGNIIKTGLFGLKNAFTRNINRTISEPESSLLSGILLGTKSSIDKNTSDNFRFVGLSHIVALSGYNITIVVDAIMKFLSFLPRNIAFSGGIFGIILFVVMTGTSSTAVRAGIMALIVIFAQVIRRKYKIGRALIIAGLIMLIINPKILVFDISFQLSFLATIAIIYVSPILNEKFKFITEKFKLRETISATISAQILVLPLILYKMGLLSLVALPANILVILLIPATILFGFITGILGFIWPPLSLPFAWISWVLLAYIINVSKFLASLPLSHVNISWFSEVFMILCYSLIIFWLYYEYRRKK